MDIKQLIEKQKELDARIEERIDAKPGELLYDRYMAFKVELCEMLNADGEFKFWKQSHEADRSKVLEEYVDALHFILSIGIAAGVRDGSEKGFKTWRSFIVTADHLMMNDLDHIMRNWHSFFREFLGLGDMLGFSEEEITEAYLSKNEVNHKRQDNDY